MDAGVLRVCSGFTKKRGKGPSTTKQGFSFLSSLLADMGGCCAKAVAPDGSYKLIRISNFIIGKGLGKGAFGRVCIIEHKSTKTRYALKYISKEKCIAERALNHVLQERSLLEEVHHPFICNMRYSFQDEFNLYMILDLMPGGDLRAYLKRPLAEDVTRSIIAEIASAIEYLHGQGIIHRDIKPDNILLDEKGHAYLSDFNIAVRYTPIKLLKSVAGTEPYMAPELLLGGGYSGSIDWWSLGVVMFEMIFVERPFRGKHKRDLIKKGEWIFPAIPNNHYTSADPPSSSCQQAIKGFMEMDVNKRFGVGLDGLQAMKQSSFFSSVAWDRLHLKEHPAPFVPPANNVFLENPSAPSPELEHLRPKANGTKKPEAPNVIADLNTMQRKFLYYDDSLPKRLDMSMPSMTNIDNERQNSYSTLDIPPDGTASLSGAARVSSIFGVSSVRTTFRGRFFEEEASARSLSRTNSLSRANCGRI
ncbi:kinase-like domain-containing protein [Polychytrium aggregatum]|uniref:kinase-like domain-containing protein n=1 Tax=Polychytrium aggregatum TaxID=110093 RepID=UPI0022FF1775|nr:kinase-like domain-containing protein [Polychytrium aggregatum]KAI9209333.1 kinase-like domain-containing protein [Polychytrium aggregatum]